MFALFHWHVVAFATVVSGFAFTPPVLAQSDSELTWAGLGRFERFKDASYYFTNVHLEGRIRERIASEFGLPDVLYSTSLTTDGVSLVVYADIEDVQLTYEKDGVELPSTDDAYDGAVASVVFYDGRGFGYIIGAGVIPSDLVENADRANIEAYRFYILDFMANNEGAPSYVVPTASISKDTREANGIKERGGVSFGSTDSISISVISGPPGDFVQVADERYTMFLGQLNPEAISESDPRFDVYGRSLRAAKEAGVFYDARNNLEQIYIRLNDRPAYHFLRTVRDDGQIHCAFTGMDAKSTFDLKCDLINDGSSGNAEEKLSDNPLDQKRLLFELERLDRIQAALTALAAPPVKIKQLDGSQRPADFDERRARIRAGQQELVNAAAIAQQTPDADGVTRIEVREHDEPGAYSIFFETVLSPEGQPAKNCVLGIVDLRRETRYAREHNFDDDCDGYYESISYNDRDRLGHFPENIVSQDDKQARLEVLVSALLQYDWNTSQK